MLKLTLALLTIAFASTASAGGWRSLRIDGSSEDGFSKSVAAFQEELSPARRYVFERALQDIWARGSRAAEAEDREYKAAEYFRELDGLSYKEVIKLSDPSGHTARERYYAAVTRLRGPRATPEQPPPSQPGMVGFSGEQVRGIDSQAQAMQERLMDKGTLR